MKVPFNKPFIIGKELEYLRESVRSGHIAGDGLFTRKCHSFMQESFKAKKILLTTSCTAALEMAAILCEIGSGDEVILPSFTFVSTANAFFLRGAKPVFVDIRPDTLNIDETKIKSAITKRTKLIVPVHYGGVACAMDAIMEIARDNGLYVVEDAAQGFNAQYKDRYLGTIGDLGAFSFHETKNVICGEGGAISINNGKFIKRAEVIREKGTDRASFFRGEVDKYTWIDTGSSYLPSDLLAAFLYSQLERIDDITKRRRAIYEFYFQELLPLADKGLLQLPVIPPECGTNHHLFHVILRNGKMRDDLLNYLKSKGVGAVFHYIPLHLSPIGRSMGYRKGQFPVTESVSARLARLPFYYALKMEEQAYVIKSIKQFFSRKTGVSKGA